MAELAAWACMVLVMTFALGIILLVTYGLTDGVKGIARRLYAMLLLFVSAIAAGFVIGVPLLLCAAVMWGGIYVVAAAIGVPFATLACLSCVRFANPSSFDKREPGSKWFDAYLNWIKRVAQGKKKW